MRILRQVLFSTDVRPCPPSMRVFYRGWIDRASRGDRSRKKGNDKTLEKEKMAKVPAVTLFRIKRRRPPYNIHRAPSGVWLFELNYLPCSNALAVWNLASHSEDGMAWSIHKRWVFEDLELTLLFFRWIAWGLHYDVKSLRGGYKMIRRIS